MAGSDWSLVKGRIKREECSHSSLSYAQSLTGSGHTQTKLMRRLGESSRGYFTETAIPLKTIRTPGGQRVRRLAWLDVSLTTSGAQLYVTWREPVWHEAQR